MVWIAVDVDMIALDFHIFFDPEDGGDEFLRNVG
jgi:hypothetical protein